MGYLYICIAISAVVYILSAYGKEPIAARVTELARITFWSSLAVALVATYLK